MAYVTCRSRSITVLVVHAAQEPPPPLQKQPHDSPLSEPNTPHNTLHPSLKPYVLLPFLVYNNLREEEKKTAGLIYTLRGRSGDFPSAYRSSTGRLRSILV